MLPYAPRHIVGCSIRHAQRVQPRRVGATLTHCVRAGTAVMCAGPHVKVNVQRQAQRAHRVGLSQTARIGRHARDATQCCLHSHQPKCLRPERWAKQELRDPEYAVDVRVGREDGDIRQHLQQEDLLPFGPRGADRSKLHMRQCLDDRKEEGPPFGRARRNHGDVSVAPIKYVMRLGKRLKVAKVGRRAEGSSTDRRGTHGVLRPSTPAIAASALATPSLDVVAHAARWRKHCHVLQQVVKLLRPSLVQPSLRQPLVRPLACAWPPRKLGEGVSVSGHGSRVHTSDGKIEHVEPKVGGKRNIEVAIGQCRLERRGAAYEDWRALPGLLDEIRRIVLQRRLFRIAATKGNQRAIGGSKKVGAHAPASVQRAGSRLFRAVDE
mmetsp:Transcript_67159/g.184192  ORF Transcript_67159/g.184192 Transcript_67159/m.184192 type:complete len:380 (+) Transcript_67159:374-1513(+)